jgi:hypothetical protein
MRYLGCLLVLFLLCGCSQEDLLQKFSSPADQATAKDYINKLQAHDFDEIEKAADDSIRSSSLHETLVNMAGLLPAGDPTSTKLVGARRLDTPDATIVNTTFEYNFGGKWFLINVAEKAKGSVKTIVGFHVSPETQPLELQNRFTLYERSLAAYTVLALAISAMLLTFYALVACVRTRMPGRKWLWILFIIIGIGKFSFNWTTGHWDISPLFVQLFSASAFAPLNGPWTISASVPLGAILFLVRRKKLATVVA